MRSVWNKLKIVLIVLVVVLLIVLCIFTMDMGNYPNLASEYNSVGTERNTGVSAMKKLDFIATYIKATGNIQIAIDKGFGDLVKDTGPADDNSDGDTDEDGGNPELSGDFKEQVTALQSSGVWAEYYKKQLVIDSDGMYHEAQSKNVNLITTGGSTVGSAGCYIYALCQARSYITGKVFTTLDFCKAFGLTAVINGRGEASGACGIAGVGKGKFTESTISMSVKSVPIDSMEKGKYYIVYGYGSSGIATKDGRHWRVCQVDPDKNKYYLLPNCKQAGMWVSKQDFMNLYSNGGAVIGSNDKTIPGTSSGAPGSRIFEASFTG